MNISMLDVYLLTRLEYLNIILGWGIAIPLVIAGCMLFALFFDAIDSTNDVPDWVTMKKVAIYICIAFFIGVIHGLTPTTKEMAVIYVTPKIVNNKQVQELPMNVLELANSKLEELIGTVKEKVKEKVK